MQIERTHTEQFTFTLSDQEVLELVTKHIAEVFQKQTGKSLASPGVDVDIKWTQQPNAPLKQQMVAHIEIDHLYTAAEQAP